MWSKIKNKIGELARRAVSAIKVLGARIVIRLMRTSRINKLLIAVTTAMVLRIVPQMALHPIVMVPAVLAFGLVHVASCLFLGLDLGCDDRELLEEQANRLELIVVEYQLKEFVRHDSGSSGYINNIIWFRTPPVEI